MITYKDLDCKEHAIEVLGVREREEILTLRGNTIKEEIVHTCDRGIQLEKSTRKKRNPYRSKKVGCPCTFRAVRYNQDPEYTYIIKTAEHDGHGMDDCKYEPLSEEMEEIIARHIDFAGSASKILCSLRQNQEKFGLTDHQISSLTVDKIRRLQQRLRLESRYHENDITSVEKMASMPEFHFLFLVDEGEGDNRKYCVGICTDFQAAMLTKFGESIFLDTVHSVTSTGLYQLTIVVVDEFGKGLPVAFCMSNRETGEVWKLFLEKAFERAGRDISNTVVMSDCCVTIRSVCRELCVKKHFLCWFHMMQAIDRNLGSFSRGKEKSRTLEQIKNKIRDLQKIKDKDTYKIRLHDFYTWLETNKNVQKYLTAPQSFTDISGKKITASKAFRYYFDKTWDHNDTCDMWVAYGRRDDEMNQLVWHGHATNNVIESYFNQQKYRFAHSRKAGRLDQHIQFLVGRVVSYYMADRQQSLKGISRSRKQKLADNIEHQVGRLMQPGNMCMVDASIGLGTASEEFSNTLHSFCLADLTCSCGDRSICVHLEAGTRSYGITADMVKALSKFLRSNGLLRKHSQSESKDLYLCEKTAVFCRGKSSPAFQQVLVNATVGNEFCQCDMFERSRNCAHIMALKHSPNLNLEDGDPFSGVHVKAFRPSRATPVDIDDDPAFKEDVENIEEVPILDRAVSRQNILKQLQNRLENLKDEELSMFQQEFDQLCEKVDNRKNREIPSAWPDNQAEIDRCSRSRKSTDRKWKRLFPNSSSSVSKRKKTRNDYCESIES